MKQMKKRQRTSSSDVNPDDPFQLFIASTSIRYCYYSETDGILGNTYGMCILQDFEALTPNLLARTVETVEGGGIIAILLHGMTSLKQLYTLSMDVHARYRTDAHQDVVGRFNERFLLSLANCKHCLIIDDQLNILPLSSHASSIEPLPPKSQDEWKCPELAALVGSLQDTQPVGSLVSLALTLDQAKAFLKFIDNISEKTLRGTVAMTASRGRGKSATLGLAIAGAVAFSYSNIFVTSPSPENLKTLFEFVLKGLDALGYVEREEYEIIRSIDHDKSIIRINIYRDHRQTIQYISPEDSHKLEQAELVCIDEAAAIPLPLVKKLLGPYLVFLSSTINGYEGTGRSLSLKLIEQLRLQSSSANITGRTLCEVSLSEPIRYSRGDPIEVWLYDLLCLNATDVPRIVTGCPTPDKCELYYVNRDTLFCYHKASEDFLHYMMSLYVSSHYKNSPNDLQLLSDAPAHHIFVLLPPISSDQACLPDVLCVLQVCLEGEISKTSIMKSVSRGKRAAGDLIPWTISQQFVDNNFLSLSGARVVRIATHPDLQKMGYGTKALQLLIDYYEGKFPNLSETSPAIQSLDQPTEEPVSGDNMLTELIGPRQSLPPLLCKLTERGAEQLDYVGVSYGLTTPLLRFWKRCGFLPVYLRQTQNETTGEHSCIMLRALESTDDGSWLTAYNKDFRNRFVSLLSFKFRDFSPSLSLSLLQDKTRSKMSCDLSHDLLFNIFNSYDLKRLELYTQNMADHHLITDLIPKCKLLYNILRLPLFSLSFSVANLYFINNITFNITAVQMSLLLGIGLQHKTIDALAVIAHITSLGIIGNIIICSRLN
jgi:N-acetyltransferase 10